MDILSNPITLLILFAVGITGGAIWRKYRDSKAEDNGTMQLNSAVVATVVALAVLFQLPSLSIDVNGIFTYAFDVVNAFMPLIAIIAGLGLGFNLIGKISSLFNRAL